MRYNNDDLIIVIDDKLTNLETMVADTADRELLRIEGKTDRLEDKVIRGTDLIVTTEKRITDSILLAIRNNGLDIGTWRLQQDGNNNFRFRDIDRNGLYRFTKTGLNRDVRTF